MTCDFWYYRNGVLNMLAGMLVPPGTLVILRVVPYGPQDQGATAGPSGSTSTVPDPAVSAEVSFDILELV